MPPVCKELCWASQKRQTTRSHASAGVCPCGVGGSSAPPGPRKTHLKPSGGGRRSRPGRASGMLIRASRTDWQQGPLAGSHPPFWKATCKTQATELYPELVTWHFSAPSHLASPQRPGPGGCSAHSGRGGRARRLGQQDHVCPCLSSSPRVTGSVCLPVRSPRGLLKNVLCTNRHP